jgi:hypothetical protein
MRTSSPEAAAALAALLRKPLTTGAAVIVCDRPDDGCRRSTATGSAFCSPQCARFAARMVALASQRRTRQADRHDVADWTVQELAERWSLAKVAAILDTRPQL